MREKNAGSDKKMQGVTRRNGNIQQETVIFFIFIFTCWPINCTNS